MMLDPTRPWQSMAAIVAVATAASLMIPLPPYPAATARYV
jgi:hypothetical protein